MSGWLRFQPSDAPLALLCLPHAGGGAGSFNRWLGLFPPDVMPVRVQLPGREDLAGEPMPPSVADVVAELSGQIAAQIDRPTAFYGHSMGALIAFELARVLPPVHLFLSGRRAPHRTARRALIHHLPDGEFVAALEAMGGTVGDGARSRAFLRYAVPLIKADLRLTEDHVFRPRPRLDRGIDAFYGTDDPVVDADEIDAWRELTDGEFSMHTYRGDHFFHQRHRAAIAKTIIERVRRNVVQGTVS